MHIVFLGPFAAAFTFLQLSVIATTLTYPQLVNPAVATYPFAAFFAEPKTESTIDACVLFIAILTHAQIVLLTPTTSILFAVVTSVLPTVALIVDALLAEKTLAVVTSDKLVPACLLFAFRACSWWDCRIGHAISADSILSGGHASLTKDAMALKTESILVLGRVDNRCAYGFAVLTFASRSLPVAIHVALTRILVVPIKTMCTGTEQFGKITEMTNITMTALTHVHDLGSVRL